MQINNIGGVQKFALSFTFLPISSVPLELEAEIFINTPLHYGTWRLLYFF